MQVFEHDVSPYAGLFMAARQAFGEVFASTKFTLKASAPRRALGAFVGSWGALDAALPEALKENIRTLPITESAIVLSGVPTEDASFTIGRGYKEGRYNFPICSLATYVCDRAETTPLDIRNTVFSRGNKDWHFDQSGSRYLLSLLGINTGTPPNATAWLSLSTALQNPEFCRLVSNHETLGPVINQNPTHFGNVLHQADFAGDLRSLANSIQPPIKPTGAVILGRGQALLFFNPNIMHARLGEDSTKEMFPDAKGTEGDRRLMRHFLPINPSQNPLLNALHAAKERLGKSP